MRLAESALLFADCSHRTTDGNDRRDKQKAPQAREGEEDGRAASRWFVYTNLYPVRDLTCVQLDAFPVRYSTPHPHLPFGRLQIPFLYPPISPILPQTKSHPMQKVLAFTLALTD